jgi:hypothetical protein
LVIVTLYIAHTAAPDLKKTGVIAHAAHCSNDAIAHYLFNALIVDEKDWEKIRMLDNTMQQKRAAQ